MLDFVGKGVAKIFGSKSGRDLKKIYPYVDAINEEWQKLNQPDLSDDGLRTKSQEIQDYIVEQLKDIDDQIAELRREAEENQELDVFQKEDIFNQVDKLEEKRDERLEEILLEVLPQAFAIVKETAYRFKEKKELQVEATFLDKQIAAQKPNVEIKGETAIWYNKWMAAGAEVEWKMLHYDVQLIGGVVLHQGKVAEMATGEGKTLVATLPAFLNALAKRGVHIVTVNDYLAKRDSEWMAPIFEFHGLTVDCIDKYKPNTEERRQAYKADITYGTNNEFGFDYLRDNMVEDTNRLVQHKHHYAMIDEVDSVLVDEARTPLIISGPIPKGDEHEYYELKPRIQRVYEAQKKLVQDFLNDSKKKIKSGLDKEAGLPLFRAFRGLPKNRPLIKFLGEEGMKVLLQKTENIYLADNSKLMPEADEPLYFTIDEKNNQVELTEKGIEYITSSGEDTNFFILPDIGMEIAAIEDDKVLSTQEKAEQKEKLINDYSTKAQRIHSMNQLLKAYTLFEKDTEYVIMDSKVKIVDEQTGRVMDGRRYSDGLHQALEAKENVKVEDATQTYATITLQNYFRMYHKLAGMTGTAETEAGEFWEIYKLDVVVIPTNLPIIRDDRNDLIYKSMREKFNAVADEILQLNEQGRPVLVGTTSVEISELLSRMLNLRKIKHQVLNAKLHQKEAEIVAEAGKPGAVTIATNMAGRGTDIKLDPKSKEAGGLAIIGTERHESRRVDRQLRGRSGRQGDPGSSQFFVSLEDNLMRLFGSDRMAKIMDRMGLKEGEVIQHSMMTKSIERAQRKVEENNFSIRKNLLEYDDVMNKQREIIYKRRKNALFGDRLEVDILNTLYQVCEDICNSYSGEGNYENFKVQIYTVLNMEIEISEDEFNKGDIAALTDLLFDQAEARYESKNQRIIDKALPVLKDVHRNRGSQIKDVVVPIVDGKHQIPVSANLEKVIQTSGQALTRAMERFITLSIIDQQWKEHLREMDDLRQSVRMAVHEQKDPLLIYKMTGFDLFESFLAKVNQDMVTFLMKADLPAVEESQVQEAKGRTRRRQTTSENKAEAKSLLSGGGSPNVQTNTQQAVEEKVQPAKSDKGLGRNAKVTVQYNDGTRKEGVKYKTVEKDLKDGKCVLVEE